MSRPRAFHPLPVAEVIAETEDACSLVLDVPPGLAGAFTYRPGQFLTIRVPGSDGPVARCYSLSSSPHTGDRHTITVKRAGYASNWIADHVRAGTVLQSFPHPNLVQGLAWHGNLLATGCDDQKIRIWDTA